MKKFSLLLIQVLLPALLLAAPEGDVTGEQSLDPRIMTAEPLSALPDPKAAWLKGRDEDAAKEADRLIESIRAADRDTLDLPEAGFSVLESNPELEKLLNRGIQNTGDLEYLLSDLKNGFYRQRIIETLSLYAPEKATEAFRAALKDRSSGVRMSALKALAQSGEAGSGQIFTALLYDRYAQRRDYYPIRAAARDAIDFIKLKAGLQDIKGSEMALKYCAALKEGAGKKQQFFCELCGAELKKSPEGADAVYSAYLELKSSSATVSGAAITLAGQEGGENAAYFLLSVLASLKDARIKEDITALLADKDRPLAGFRLLLALDPVEALKSYFPADLKAGDLLEMLSENIQPDAGPLSFEPDSDAVLRDSMIRKVMSVRKFSSYVDAATRSYELLFDREKALAWLSDYDPSASGMEQPYNRGYGNIKALCLLSGGKPEEAARFNPYAPVRVFKKYISAINTLRMVPPESSGYRTVGEALFKAYLALDLIPCAMRQLKELSSLPAADGSSGQKYLAESKRLGERQAEKIGNIEPAADSGEPAVLLKLQAAETGIKPGEDIKVFLSLQNTSAEPACIVDSSGGPLGFDAGLFADGVIVKRLFSDETEKLTAEEKTSRVIVIAPGTSYEKEFTLLAGAQNTAEREYQVFAAYDGGTPLKTFAKGWTGKLISDIRKVTVKK